MKRVLMTLAVVTFLAGPLFARVSTTLVYTVSGSMKGWNFTDASRNFASSDSEKVKGYVVFNVDDATLETAPQVDSSDDPNITNNTTFIALGSTANFKKAFAVVRNGIDVDDVNTVTMDLATADQPIFTTLNNKGVATKTQMVDAGFSASVPLLFDFSITTSMFGKLTNVTLATDTKILLPKTLSAAGELHAFDATGFESDDLIGTTKLSLNTSYTKKVFDFSVLKATVFIAADLIDKGYTQVSINDLITSE